MRVVVQRVKKASVSIDNEVTAKIGKGLMVLAAIAAGDNSETIKWMANKLVNLRVFEDEAGKMNKSLPDIGGELLIVSNFTLYGDARKGFRPSFTDSAPPDISKPLYEQFVNYIKDNYPLKTESGVFAAMMDIELINDGPVTIIIDK